jgi:hypothetical protein
MYAATQSSRSHSGIATTIEDLSLELLDDLDRSLLGIRWDRLLGHEFPPEKGLRAGVGGQHAGQIVPVERSFCGRDADRHSGPGRGEG